MDYKEHEIVGKATTPEGATIDILSQMDKPEVWCVTCVMPEAMAQSSESEDPNAGN